MKKIFGGAGQIILAAFTVVIVGFMAVMNYQTLGRVFPDDPMQQIWGMALFTGGTLSWFAIFLLASRGFQRPIAMVMFILSLAGEVFYSAADVLMGGQSWVTVSASLGTYVIYSFIGLTFAHGLALYVHFFTKPDVIATIDTESLEDEVKAKAQERATELINARVEGMAEQLAMRVADTVFVNLRLPMSTVIDADARDVNDLRPAQGATDKAEKAGLFHRDENNKPPVEGGLSDPDIERLARAWTDFQLHQPAPPPFTAISDYTLDRFMEAIGLDRDDARAQLTRFGLDKDADKAFDALSTYGVLPGNLSRENYHVLHNELFSSTSETVPTVDAQFRGQAT